MTDIRCRSRSNAGGEREERTEGMSGVRNALWPVSDRATRSRTGFFEKLEERLGLNGIPIAKDDLGYSTPVDTALVVSGDNHPLLENDWDQE